MSSTFTAAEIVAAVYRTILLREADPVGLQHAAGQLEQHHAIEQLLQGMIGSPEFRTNMPQFNAYYRLTEARSDGISQSATSGERAVNFQNPDILHTFMLNHAAWRGSDVLERAGDPVSRLTNPELYCCSSALDRAALGIRGVRVHGMAEGAELIIVFDESAAPISLDLYAGGHTDNLVVFGSQCAVQGDIRFGGGGNLVFCGGRGEQQYYRVALYTTTSAFVFGADSTSVGAYFHIEGPRRHVVVGRDCMFSAEVYVAATDNHAIIDKATGTVLNPPEDILIGPHAWIGFGATILKGVDVGADAIIAARALLTRSAPPGALLAGAPAKIVREGVTWHRAFPSDLPPVIGPDQL